MAPAAVSAAVSAVVAAAVTGSSGKQQRQAAVVESSGRNCKKQHQHWQATASALTGNSSSRLQQQQWQATAAADSNMQVACMHHHAASTGSSSTTYTILRHIPGTSNAIANSLSRQQLNIVLNTGTKHQHSTNNTARGSVVFAHVNIVNSKMNAALSSKNRHIYNNKQNLIYNLNTNEK